MRTAGLRRSDEHGQSVASPGPVRGLGQVRVRGELGPRGGPLGVSVSLFILNSTRSALPPWVTLPPRSAPVLCRPRGVPSPGCDSGSLRICVRVVPRLCCVPPTEPHRGAETSASLTVRDATGDLGGPRDSHPPSGPLLSCHAPPPGLADWWFSDSFFPPCYYLPSFFWKDRPPAVFTPRHSHVGGQGTGHFCPFPSFQ